MKKLFILMLAIGSCYILSAQMDVSTMLIARNTGIKVLANNDTIRVFGFAEGLMEQPGVPGPTIIANEGDSVQIDMWNVSQGAPHTIHLHGLDVDQENDGVPHLSFDIPHMEHGYYRFKAPHAGTYLYHCHVASTIHVQAGMYGLIIIKPTDGSNTTWNNGYSFDKEFSYFMSEIDTVWHTDDVLNHDYDTSMAVHHVKIPDYFPQFFLINGLSDNQLPENNTVFNSSINTVNYVRLTNIGYYGNRVIFPEGLHAKIIDSDGRPLPQVEENDTVVLYPGERYGILCEAKQEFNSSIKFEYINMNTLEVKNTQIIPVNIIGTNIIVEKASSLLDIDVYPNPCNDETTSTIKLSQAAHVSITVFDMLGKKLQQIINTKFPKGSHSFKIGKSLDSGVYLLQFRVNDAYNYSKTFIKE